MFFQSRFLADGSRILGGLLLMACASTWHRQGDPCASLSGTIDAPFDSTTAGTLAGSYDLIIVSDWEDEIGRSAHGRLELWPTDSLHQFGERGPFGWRRFGNRPLWGTAKVSAETITLPWTADPASSDPERPGVLVYASGVLELGVWRGMDGSSTSLRITRVSTRGFAGTWNSDLGIMTLIRDGRSLPNPHGHFCAIRR